MFFTVSADPRRRRRESERDQERDRRKDRDRERKSRRSSQGSTRKVSSSTSNREKEREGEREQPSPGTADMVPEMQRRPSPTGPSAYPSFSKAHSKEALGNRENVANPRLSLYTPDPTDLEAENHNPAVATPPRRPAPPSPPLTATEELEVRRVRSGTSIRRNTPERLKVDTARRNSLDAKTRPSATSKSKTSKYIPKSRLEAQDRSEIAGSSQSSAAGSKQESTETSSSATANANRQVGLSTDARSQDSSTETGSMTNSDATSVPQNKAPPRPSPLSARPAVATAQSSPSSVADPSPKTPTSNDAVFPNIPPDAKQAPAVGVLNSSGQPSPYSQSLPSVNAAPPPPPPPVPIEIPRVDYLLQNGGLSYVVPKKLLHAASPASGGRCGSY